MKSLEQRIYEALRSFKGMRLSSDDVFELSGRDDAIRTRISNVACAEAGVSEVNEDCVDNAKLTWKQFSDQMREAE